MDISPDAARLHAHRIIGGHEHRYICQASFLIAADMLAGLALIFFGRAALLSLAPSYAGALDADGLDVTRVLCLLCIIGALMLREPMLARRAGTKRSALRRMLNWRLGATLVLLLACAVGTATRPVARDIWPAVWVLLFGIWALVSRGIFQSLAWRKTAQGQEREAVAVIGPCTPAGRVAARIAADADVIAVIDRMSLGGSEELLEDDPLLDGFAEVAILARAGDIDTIIVALAQEDQPEIGALVDRLKALPVQVALCTDPGGLQACDQMLRTLPDLHLAVVAERPVAQWGRWAKAVLDRIGAAALMILLLPLMILLALAIACDSPGPVIFSQCRNGWAGGTFTLYKFRTMRHTGSAAVIQTKRNDPRCTRVGLFLRQTSLDELPQLWNVLIGDMSLVGPRPHVDRMHARERAGCELIAEYAKRQRMLPGMTGWAQVHGLRGGIQSPEQLRRRVDYDLFYIDNWSFFLDLRILAMTPLAVLRAENAF